MWLLLLVAAASQPPRRLSLARGDPPPHAAISWPSNGAVGAPSAAQPGVVPVVEPLAPNEVTDVCGGYPGHTKLNEVGQDCAAWTVETLRCMQVFIFLFLHVLFLYEAELHSFALSLQPYTSCQMCIWL